MTRRDFLAGAVAVPALAGVPEVWLEAVVAPSLPARIAMPASAIGAHDALFELRTYKDRRVATQVWGRLSARGRFSTCLSDSRTLLIPFESMTARHQAWREFQADHAWQTIRDHGDASYQFSLYRRERTASMPS